jgi:hypothetical protein
LCVAVASAQRGPRNAILETELLVTSLLAHALATAIDVYIRQSVCGGRIEQSLGSGFYSGFIVAGDNEHDIDGIVAAHDPLRRRTGAGCGIAEDPAPLRETGFERHMSAKSATALSPMSWRSPFAERAQAWKTAPKSGGSWPKSAVSCLKRPCCS